VGFLRRASRHLALGLRAKFGVRSRGQLLAAIFGSHYLPLMKDSSH
jgi:hypothetical protein